jgi:hypothetical protein
LKAYGFPLETAKRTASGKVLEVADLEGAAVLAVREPSS